MSYSQNTGGEKERLRAYKDPTADKAIANVLRKEKLKNRENRQRNRQYAKLHEYREDEELYVYDQCCENCRYYCDWGEWYERGCKLFDRPDYEQYPKDHWCCDWKRARGRR